MLRLAIKNVRHNPRRLILTVVAVALGVGLVSATHIFTNALYNGIDGAIGDTYDAIDVVVTPPEDITYDDADVTTLADIAGVNQAAGVMTDGVQGKLFGTDGESTGQDFGPPDIFLPWTGIAALDGSTVTQGHPPEQAGEIVLSEQAASVADAVLGDKVEVAAINDRFTATVVGIATVDDDLPTFGARFSYLTLDDLRLIAGPQAGYNQLVAIAIDGSGASALDAATTAFPGASVVSGPEFAQQQVDQFGAFLSYVDIFTLAFAFIAVFVGAYIIVNTFRILVTQRTRELGLLRAIGATGRQVRRMVLLEALVVGIVSSLVGVILGWLLALVVVGFLTVIGAKGLFGTLTIPLDAWIWGMSTGILITLVSALLPAITASRISPMEALREQAHTMRKGLIRRNVVGGALSLGGGLLIAIGLYAGPARPYIYVAAGAVALVLGVTLLAAQILVPLAVSLRNVLTRVWRVDGRLAANNIERESRRSANTAAALMIGVLLLALTATFTESVKSLVREELSGVAAADFFVAGNPIPVPEGIVADLEGVPGVATASRLGFVADAELAGEPIGVGAVDPETAKELWNLDATPPATEIGDDAYATQAFLDEGHSVGDTLAITTGTGEHDVTIVGSIGSNVNADIVVSFDTAQAMSDEVLLAQVGVALEDGADADATRTALEETVSEDFPLLGVTSPDDLLSVVNQVVDTILAVLYALLAGAIVIAVLGVANTLSLSVTERTREIGLLRAVGMSRRSVRRIIRIEAVVMALLGAVLGTVLGVGLGVAIIRALNEFGFTVITVPWLQMLAFTLLAIVAGIVAAILPALRASRLDILKAIAADG